MTNEQYTHIQAQLASIIRNQDTINQNISHNQNALAKGQKQIITLLEELAKAPIGK